MHARRWTPASRAGRLGRRCLWLAVLVPILGCGSRLPFAMGTVEGTVTYQGKPLTYGRVVFLPEQGTPGPDGSYRMKTVDRDGAALGWHRVTVHCRAGVIVKEDQNRPESTVPKTRIPRKYSVADQSPLRFEVKEGRNEWPIVLE